MSEAIGYLRVSTREQGRSGLGLAAQRRDIEAFGVREGFSVKLILTPVRTGTKTESTSMRRRATLVELFERHVSRDVNGCWLWTGSRNSGGYGVMKRLGKQVSAHRISWQLARGTIPPDLHVLHRCDNPACVRPEHLFLGTNQDNIADRIAKQRPGGRPPTGSERLSRRKRPKPRVLSIKFGDLVTYRGERWHFISRFNNKPPANSRRFCSLLNCATGELLCLRLNELELSPSCRS